MIPTTGLEVAVVEQAAGIRGSPGRREGRRRRDETRDKGSKGDEEWTGAGGVTGDVFIDEIQMSRWRAREEPPTHANAASCKQSSSTDSRTQQGLT